MSESNLWNIALGKITLFNLHHFVQSGFLDLQVMK